MNDEENMNALPVNCIVVTVIKNDCIEVIVTGSDNFNQLQKLGFSTTRGRCTKNIYNNNEKQDVINELIDVGALFLFGYGWYPSEVMADYVERGIINKTYKIISWTNRTTYLIEICN